jgi:hypothetical protein
VEGPSPDSQEEAWKAAHARLHALFPECRDSLTRYSSLNPDPIYEAAELNEVPIQSVLIYNPWRGNPEGIGVKPYDQYGTLELFDLVFAEWPPTPGPLWFICDNCARRRSIYLVLGEHLREFVETSPCEFDLDVVFIWCDTPRVTLIHHEGAFFHIGSP